MGRGRRPRSDRSELFATERPPRLVLRFAVILSVALALASALILAVVHHFAITEAERSATKHANLVASAVLHSAVERADLRRRVPADRRRSLNGAIRPLLVSDPGLGVSLVRQDGLVTYSSNRARVGTHVSPEYAAEAAHGTTVSFGSELTSATNGAMKTLETFAPVEQRKAAGAAMITQPYAPIEQTARAAQLRVGIVLEALLLILIAVFVPLLARVTRRISAQMDRIHHQAYYDQLTGLPNRAHLFDRLHVALQRAGSRERMLAVMVLDLDQFREINNTVGHETGDALLAEAARRFRHTADDDWLVARLGGDEFAIVVEYEEEKDVKLFAERLRKALDPPTFIAGLPFALDSSIGIALFPKDGYDAETLVKHAEVATYAAKEWRVDVLAYSPSVDRHDPDQLELVGELREAAKLGQLELRYQPKVDLATSEIVGFEALTYWGHPTRGLLPPGAFIPIAERTGAIRHVTRAVFVAAVDQLSEWNSTERPVSVSVNVTAIDLLDPKLPRQLGALLRKRGVDPARLCIELTERTVMAAPDRAASILKRLVASGIQVSIDDFGTGHSSLALLRTLPVHEVKIDRSFVADMTVSPHDRMIVHAAIQLGHSLGLRVVAEGVETTAVHDALRDQGCDEAQGFLYGRPEPATTATELLGGTDLKAA